MSALCAAVDVGGTFIDVIVADRNSNSVAIAKLPSDKGIQGHDLVAIFERLSQQCGSNVEHIDSVVIGTTVVTNALLEGSLPRTALLTTRGFRDVLEIARMERASSYDLLRRRPAPLVPRHLRFEVPERVAENGEVIHELEEGSVVATLRRLRDAGVESVAVCLLFSFANARHERRIGEIVSQELKVPVSLSSDVLPVFREYERTSTTVINAATLSIIDRFIKGLQPLIARGVHRIYIMGSEGGCLTLQEARRYPVRCIMSGPAGGVIGGLELAVRHGFDSALTLDVGGTSTDVALVRNGVIPYTDQRTVAGYSVALPSVEVETIGAGGGSIAHIDPTGLLRVGPVSAGADPGPICYRRGGTRPTVTDAHVALGRLGARTMLGGTFVVDRDAAVRGIEEHLAGPLGLEWVRAAQGILEVVTANIIRAVRAISVERGHDPRQLTLVAFGGAGPLHALDVARSLEIPRVLIPRWPGVWSAYGILSSDIRYSAYRTWFRNLSDIAPSELEHVLERLEAGLVERVTADDLDAATLRTERSVDLRYRGQSHTLTIPVRELNGHGSRTLAAAFHTEHERRYGHSAPEDILEIVNLRVTAIYPHAPSRESGVSPRQTAPANPVDNRSVWLSGSAPVRCPIYYRDDLPSGQMLEGPAVIEQYDSTVVLSPTDKMEVMGRGLDLLVHVGHFQSRAGTNP